MDKKILEMLGDPNPDMRILAVQKIAGMREREHIYSILDAFSDEDWRVRNSAVEALLLFPLRDEVYEAAMGILYSSNNIAAKNAVISYFISVGGDAVSFLMSRMGGSNHEVKKFICDILGEIRTNKATKILISLFDNTDSNVIIASVEALGKIEDKSAVESLLNLMKHEDPLVVFSVVKSLEKIRDARAVEPLINNIKNPFIKRAAIEALGSIGDIRALNSLASALENETQKVKEVALTAITALFDKSTEKDQIQIKRKIKETYSKNIMQFLINLLDAKRLVIPACRLLGWVSEGSAISRIAKYLDSDYRQAAIQALLDMERNPVIEYLCNEANNANGVTKETIAYILGELGKTEGGTKRCVSALLKLIKDENGHVRQSSADALGKIKDINAVDHLIKLLDDRYPNIQNAAINALSNMGKEAVSAKLFGYLTSEHTNYRINTTLILGRLNVANALPYLEVVLKDENPMVRKAVVGAVSGMYNERIDELLKNALADEEPAVRLEALKALVTRIGIQNIEHVSMLVNDENIWVRAAVAKFLAGWDEPQSRRYLYKLAKDDAVNVRVSSLESLGKLKDKASVPLLIQTLKEEDPELKKAALKALSETGEISTVEVIKSYLEDTDWGVRAAAAKTLGVLCDFSSVFELEKLSEDDPDSLVRATAKFALEQISNG